MRFWWLFTILCLISLFCWWAGGMEWGTPRTGFAAVMTFVIAAVIASVFSDD